MTDDNEDYKVGYKKPPKESRFKKEVSGNPAGRRPKVANPVDVGAILETPITVKQAGEVTTMHPFEAMARQFLRQALQDKNLFATIELLRLWHKYKILIQPAAPAAFSPVQYIPRDWDHDEWCEMLFRFGPPPWPGPRNGLCKSQR